jgi:hypothetical protein
MAGEPTSLPAASPAEGVRDREKPVPVYGLVSFTTETTGEREITVPVIYRGRTIALGFRADILVDNLILIEIKAVAQLIPAHQSQLLTYLRMSG